jgi:hypothetical protein
MCGSRSAGLESLWPVRAAWVRIPLPAPILNELIFPEGSVEHESERVLGVSPKRSVPSNSLLPAVVRAVFGRARDARLERAGLREDNDLHGEALVLVSRATGTLTGR